MEEFHVRLLRIMEELDVTQSELCAATGISKSALSQYMSGRFKPKQNRTLALAEALRVDPAWLMGYDVPKERAASPGKAESRQLTAHEAELIDCYRRDPKLRGEIDALLERETADVFRAAKSAGGNFSPGRERMTREQLQTLRDAPETDDDL